MSGDVVWFTETAGNVRGIGFGVCGAACWLQDVRGSQQPVTEGQCPEAFSVMPAAYPLCQLVSSNAGVGKRDDVTIGCPESTGGGYPAAQQHYHSARG